MMMWMTMVMTMMIVRLMIENRILLTFKRKFDINSGKRFSGFTFVELAGCRYKREHNLTSNLRSL